MVDLWAFCIALTLRHLTSIEEMFLIEVKFNLEWQ